MKLLHVDQLANVRENEKRTIREMFGPPKTVDERLPELIERFVFYTPVVHYLIGDPDRTAISTDIVSHTLAQDMREHPLILTDLTRPVLRFGERLIVRPDLKSFQRTVYAAPREAWNATIDRLKMLTLCDRRTHRFCVLVPHVLEIVNPVGSRAELSMPVHYFQCYGNREIHYFQADSDMEKKPCPVPTLLNHPPVQEFMVMADRVLRLMAGDGRTSEEKRIERTVATMDHEESLARMFAIRDTNIPKRELSTPLDEARFNEQYIRECHDIIRFYESVFGPAGGI